MRKVAKSHNPSGATLNADGIIMLDSMEKESSYSAPSELQVPQTEEVHEAQEELHSQTDEMLPSEEVKAKKGLNKKLVIMLSVTAAVLIAASVTAFTLINSYNNKLNSVIDKDTFYDGIVVQGVELGGKTMKEAKALLKEVEPDLRDEVDITVSYGDKVYSYSQDDFKFTYNTDEVLEKAYAVGRSGSKQKRYDKVMDLKENPESFSIEATISDDNVPEIVEKIKTDINFDAVESHVSSFVPFAAEGSKFTFVEGTKGLAIDEEALSSSLSELINSEVKKGNIEVSANEIPYTYSVDDIRANTKFLSTFSTVSTNNSNGNHNMALALSKVNGTTLQPGEVFSFCTTTGNSNNGSLGYVEAGVISKGKLIQDFGGGICQASSTLYGAVIRADLGIVTRSNHSWPSTYVPIGLDAAINYPGTDFQFINNTAFPIFIEATMSGKRLTVNIYGAPSSEWDEIRVTSTQTSSTEPADPSYINDSTLAKGVTEVERTAHTGYTASAEKIYYKNGVEVKREALPSSNYKAISAIIRVGTGTAMSTPSTRQSGGSSGAPASSSAAPAPSSKPAPSSTAPAPSSSQSSSGSTADTSSSTSTSSSTEPEVSSATDSEVSSEEAIGE